MIKFLGEFKFEDLPEYLFTNFSELENFEDENLTLEVSYDVVEIRSAEDYLLDGPKLEIVITEDNVCTIKLFREHPAAEVYPDWEINWDENFEDIDIEELLNLIYDRLEQIIESEELDEIEEEE